jgi:hypothetical protein
MFGRSLASSTVAVLAGASMMALSMSPTSAFTLSTPTLNQADASSQISKVWWGWRGGRWGWWGPGAVIGGLAAGAIVGSAIAAPPYYGPGPYYGGCWRRVWGQWGWRWVRVC